MTKLGRKWKTILTLVLGLYFWFKPEAWSEPEFSFLVVVVVVYLNPTSMSLETLGKKLIWCVESNTQTNNNKYICLWFFGVWMNWIGMHTLHRVRISGWSKRVEYTPGSGSMPLFPSLHLETCEETVWNIQATVELQTGHIGKGCDRDSYSDRSVRRLCGESTHFSSCCFKADFFVLHSCVQFLLALAD